MNVPMEIPAARVVRAQGLSDWSRCCGRRENRRPAAANAVRTTVPRAGLSQGRPRDRSVGEQLPGNSTPTERVGGKARLTRVNEATPFSRPGKAAGRYAFRSWSAAVCRYALSPDGSPRRGNSGGGLRPGSVAADDANIGNHWQGEQARASCKTAARNRAVRRSNVFRRWRVPSAWQSSSLH
jgi:hypothetical protein